MLFLGSVYADHAAGGYISYKPTGITNFYEITLTLYKECGGHPYNSTIGIKIHNTCNASDPTTVILNRESVTEISQFCPQDLVNTECNQGNYTGFEKVIYRGIVLLNGLCSEWVISCQVNLRNFASNITGGDMYIETKLNNLDFPLNASPTRNTDFPIPKLRIGSNIDLSIFFNDPDHDSLEFILVSGLTAPNQAVGYTSPFSDTQPITGITIDSNTGQLNFAANQIGKFVICILINEYTNSGILKGSTRFEFNVVVDFLFLNLPPTIGSIQNFNNFNTGSNFNGNIITSCLGDQFCFDITVNDPNVNDSLILKSDISDLYPSATFIQTGYNPAVATVCWTHNYGYQRAIFSIEALDSNACPALQTVSKAFLIELDNKEVFTQNPFYICDTSIIYDLTINDSNIYHWYDLNGNLLDIGSDISANPTKSAKLYFSNDTSIVSKYINKNLCLVSDTLELKANFIPIDFFPDTITYCFGDTMIIYSPKPELNNIWNGTLTQDSLIINHSNEFYFNLGINYNGHCSTIDGTLTIPLSGTDLLIDTLIQCAANPNINIAPVNTSWYDLNGILLDIGTDIDCNPCGNPQFLFTNDTMVTKQINAACLEMDTLYIRPNESLDNYFSDTIFFCDEDTLELINPFTNYNPIWHTNDSLDTIYLQTDTTYYGSLSIYIDTLICDTKQFLLFSQQTDAPIISTANGLTTDAFVTYQWIYNNSNILGANGQSHVPQNNGDYQVLVIDSLGCKDTSDVFTITSANVEEQNNSISIYKVDHQIIIKDAPINSVIELFDLSGKLLEKRIMKGEGTSSVNLPQTKQIYIVKLLSSSGETIAVKKL